MPDATSYFIFIPRCVASDHGRILQLLSVTCGRDADNHSTTSNYTTSGSGTSTDPAATGESSGYLVLVRAGRLKEGDGEWHGGEVKIDLTGDSAIAVSHMQVTYSASLYSASHRVNVSWFLSGSLEVEGGSSRG